MPNIDDFTLNLFLCELPDPETELFLELSKNLDIFTSFPELPLEIRLEIWRLTFPGPRTVCLDPCDCRDYRESHRSFPISLQANHESRQETLQHYVIIPQPYPRSVRPRCHRPRCFDPARDALYVHFIEMRSVNFKALMMSLRPCYIRLINFIQQLEIRGWN